MPGPAPPPDVPDVPPVNVKSRSMTHIPSLARKKTSRQAIKQDPVPTHSRAPSLSGKEASLLSSAHSSSTSLTSHNITSNKSATTLSRPPSAYYSRDFLSSLAPREGGYAIAAQMGNGLGAVGTMTVEERRRSTVVDERDIVRARSSARAPMAKSAGMGRWSLDGGEVGVFLRRWPKLTS
jgi:hypothetical protein